MKKITFILFITFSLNLFAQDNFKGPNNEEVKSIFFKDLSKFPIGISANMRYVLKNDIAKQTVLENYNSLTVRFYNEFLYKNSTSTNWGDLDLTIPDKQLQFAKDHSTFIRYHAHCLVYHLGLSKAQEEFVKKASINDFEANYREHIEKILNHYKNKGFTNRSYDVINEVIKNDETAYYDNTIFRNKYATDDDFYQFVKKCFVWARNADPEAKLFYNDYGMEWGEYKNRKIISLVQKLQKERIEINGVSRTIFDGIGFQGHSDIDSFNYFNYIDALKTCAETGLLVHISELDISVNKYDKPQSENHYTEKRKQIQAELFRKVPEMYYAAVPEAQRFGITFWDLTDTDSWIPTNQRKNSRWDAATIFYSEKCDKKPSYYSFASGLAGFTLMPK